jgi:protoheme IX farnesyltransferase
MPRSAIDGPCREELAMKSTAIADSLQRLPWRPRLLPVSMLPWAFGFAETIYCIVAAVCVAILVALAVQLSRSHAAEQRSAHRLFAFSIVYLFVVIAALSSGSNRRSTTMFAHAPARVTLAQAASLPGNRGAVRSFVSAKADEA